MARERAGLAARAEFVKWLKEKVSVHAKTEDEQILFLEGSEENDADALKESGKAVETMSKKMESVAASLVRGMQVLHTEESGKNKTLTLVYGWDAKTVEAIKKVRKDLSADDKDAGAKGDGPPKAGDPKPKADKKIEDKKVTSKDAKRFIDD